MINELNEREVKAYNERLKYAVAEELGLLGKVKEQGWGSLSASETGKIGGMVAKKRKQG